MLKYTTFLLFNLFSLFSFTQVDNIELESLDDLSILEEFEQDSPKASTTGKKRTDLFKNLENAKNNLQWMADDSKTEEDFNLKGVDPETPELTNITPLEEIELLQVPLKKSSDSLERIDYKLIEEFRQMDKTYIDSILKHNIQHSQTKFTKFEILALKAQLTDISHSPIRTAYILKGKKLIRIFDNKVFYVPKNLVVKVHVLLDSHKFRYILDKDSKIRYKLHYKDSSYINKVTNLHHSPHKFIRLPEKQLRRANDKDFNYTLSTNLHSGLNRPYATQQLFSDPSALSTLLRLEASLFTKQNTFADTGVTFMYESITGELLSGGSYSLTSFSLGPSLKTKTFLSNYNLLLQPRVSVSSVAQISKKDSEKGFRLSETSALVALERHINLKSWGSLTLGLNIQRKWMKAQKSPTATSSELNYDDSAALSIGHQSDWQW